MTYGDLETYGEKKFRILNILRKGWKEYSTLLRPAEWDNYD